MLASDEELYEMEGEGGERKPTLSSRGHKQSDDELL